MIAFSTLKTQWEGVSPQKNGYIKLDIDHPLDLRMGYYSDYTKSLVIIGANTATELPSSSIVKVSNFDLTDGKKALEFRLMDVEYEDVYLRLCWDLIDVSIDSDDPLNAVINRYFQWHKLLETSGNKKALSFSKQKGLLGELIFLEELFETMSCRDAVLAWKGPEGCDQDFQFNNSWVEVKTIALAATCVNISSLEQFRQDVEGKLQVIVLEKASTGHKLINLTQQVNKIRDLLANETELLFRFELKLLLVGYKKHEENIYAENIFRLIEKREYIVNDSFPKLTKENVPNGVESAQYTLSLSGIESYRRH